MNLIPIDRHKIFLTDRKICITSDPFYNGKNNYLYIIKAIFMNSYLENITELVHINIKKDI